MNYKRIYDQLIQKRIDNPITRKEQYVECHHVIPKSEGGSDNEDNLVNLTAREHYVAHLLLARIYDDYNMWCSLWGLSNKWGRRRSCQQYVISSRQYERVRIEFAKRHSKLLKSRPTPQACLDALKRSWARPSKGMKGKHHSEATKRKMSKSKRGLRWKNTVPYSEEHRAKTAESKRGREWWHKDGKMKHSRECPGEGWERGMLKMYNNGITTVMASGCPVGFVQGRLPKKVNKT